MKRFFIFMTILLMMLIISVLTGCGKGEKTSENGERLSIVCSNFPAFDFANQIAGDEAKVQMLLRPGAELHSYEPSPKDIKKIQESDIFIYNGGHSDAWVGDFLKSTDTDNIKIVKMMDMVDTAREEYPEGMEDGEHDGHEHDGHEEHGHDESGEIDEHVWTSPVNTVRILKSISEIILSSDEKNKSEYKENAEKYIDKVKDLDREFREIITKGKRKEIIVADRFPFGYFCKEYALDFYAAFPGCSESTEASPATISFLIDKVKRERIPVIFHIELSNEQICDSVCKATGAQKSQLNSVHNVKEKDFERGISYVDLMRHNVKVLKEALN